MRLVATKSIPQGTEIAKTIYNDNGQVLVQRNMNLTDRMLKRLQQLGITYVYIKDAYTDDITIDPPIPEELRVEAIQMVKSSFASVQKEDFSKRSFIFEKTSQKMSDMVTHLVDELKNQEEVLSILSDVLISDDYVFTHSINVTIYSLALATELGLPTNKVEQIGLGAMLHDVGKMFIPEEILKKKGKLSDYEFEIIKTHTEEGFNFLRKANNIPLLAAHCAFQHHERLNGSGYPRGIAEREIHPYAKLIGVADVFDAVTSNRVYRDAMLPHEGLEILYAGSGELFDRDMVESFKKTIAIYPKGLTVELSDGRKGVVVRQNSNLYERPIVRVLMENEQKLTIPYELDLAKHLNIIITSCDTSV